MIDRNYRERETSAKVAALTAEHAFNACCGHLGFDASTIKPGASPLLTLAAFRRDKALAAERAKEAG